MKRRLVSFVLLLSFVASTSFAAIPKLSFIYEYDIKDYKGKTFLYMMNSWDGVKAATDELANDGFALEGDASRVDEVLKNVVPKVARKYIGASFKDNKNFKTNMKASKARVDAVKSLNEALADAGETYKYDDVDNACGSNLNAHGLAGLSKYSVGMFLDMVAGAGVAVHLDENNYFFNVGYDSNDEKNIQTGRSFAAGPAHSANDASDLDYLDDLEAYFKEAKEQKDFYTVMMQILTNSDASKLGGLNDKGQTIMSDFVAVYTAESLRHLMVDLSPKTAVWEWDLAAATMVSIFNVETGYMMKAADPTNPNANISLMKAKLRDHWTINPETKRSGIGKTKKARQMLSKKITAYEVENNKALVKAIADVVGERAYTDAIQATVEFLSNNDTPEALGVKGTKLTSAMVKFLMQVKADANDIKDAILADQGGEVANEEEDTDEGHEERSF